MTVHRFGVGGNGDSFARTARKCLDRCRNVSGPTESAQVGRLRPTRVATPKEVLAPFTAPIQSALPPFCPIRTSGLNSNPSKPPGHQPPPRQIQRPGRHVPSDALLQGVVPARRDRPGGVLDLHERIVDAVGNRRPVPGRAFHAAAVAARSPRVRLLLTNHQPLITLFKCEFRAIKPLKVRGQRKPELSLGEL